MLPDRENFELGSIVLTNFGGPYRLEISVGQPAELLLSYGMRELLRVVSLKRSGPQLIITLENTASTLHPSSRSPKIVGHASVGLREKRRRVSLGQRTARRTISTWSDSS